MACARCYEMYFRDCEDDMEFPLSLTAMTPYVLVVTAQPSGRQYIYNVTSDAEGSLTWPVADQPEGLFVPHMGAFSLTIEDADGDTVEFTIGYNTFDCVQFQFIDAVSIPI